MSGDRDHIFITGLAIHAYHGVMEHEGHGTEGRPTGIARDFQGGN